MENCQLNYVIDLWAPRFCMSTPITQLAFTFASVLVCPNEALHTQGAKQQWDYDVLIYDDVRMYKRAGIVVVAVECAVHESHKDCYYF